LKVTFLGTGTSQGVPVIACECEVCRSLDFRDNRTRSSVLIEYKGVSILIDAGPDFRFQMLRERVKRIDAVLFTHAHKDHTAGLDDIRSFNFRQKSVIPIYGTQEVLNQIKQEFRYIFDDKSYPGIPQLSLNVIDDQSFNIKGLEVIPIPVMHHKMPVLGFRVGNFTYITDANHIPPLSRRDIEGTYTLVLNALQKEPHISHFTLEEAIQVSKELKIPQTYLTHISHRLGLHQKVSEEIPKGVALSYDGLQLTF
jgi:phosphoribosyl 1,2-cyclic phosphate phosphodiesterase